MIVLSRYLDRLTDHQGMHHNIAALLPLIPCKGKMQGVQYNLILLCRQICSTVCMAKPTKAAEFRSLSEEEIEKEIYDCQSSLFFARIAQKQRKVRLHFRRYQCMPVSLKLVLLIA